MYLKFLIIYKTRNLWYSLTLEERVTFNQNLVSSIVILQVGAVGIHIDRDIEGVHAFRMHIFVHVEGNVLRSMTRKIKALLALWEVIAKAVPK